MLRNNLRSLMKKIGFEVRSMRSIGSSAYRTSLLLKNASVDVIFDVGANVGQFATEIRSQGFDGKIISIEPLTTARERLLSRAAKDDKWLVHSQCAAGEEQGILEINVSANSVSSSLLPMRPLHLDAAAASKYVAKERIPVMTLDSIYGVYIDSGSVPCLKIDTQGYEKQVLNGAYKMLRQVKVVICELSFVPVYEGQALWREIIDLLSNQGFILYDLQAGFFHPETGQLMQADGVFLRGENEHYG